MRGRPSSTAKPGTARAPEPGATSRLAVNVAAIVTMAPGYSWPEPKGVSLYLGPLEERPTTSNELANDRTDPGRRSARILPLPVRALEPPAFARSVGEGLYAELVRDQAQQRLSPAARGPYRRRYRRDLRRAPHKGQGRAFLQHHELVRARPIQGPEHAPGDGAHRSGRIPLHRPDADRGRLADAAIPQVSPHGRAPAQIG